MGCGSSSKSAGDAKTPTPPAAVGGKKVKVHVGPIEVGSDGLAVKPKFNLGITGGTLHVMAGVSDVRDGLRLETYAQAQKSYSSEGSSITEVLENVKAAEPLPVIDELITAVPDILAEVLRMTGADLKTNTSSAEGVVYIYTGVGVTAGVFLGWVDTAGFRMVGAEGKVAAGASVAATVKAGVHEDGKSVRVTVYLTNVGFDVIVKCTKPVDPKAVE